MTKTKMSVRSRQRGVALLITLFTLLLLSVIGLGMMISASTETLINTNYKDKQAATFAVMAGLQEARDRLQPATLHINPPAGMPSLTAGNIIYIINPKNGETVAPWDATNKYMDTELCQENILGLTGIPEVPCTTVPSGSSWYTVHDNSQSSAAPWNFANPLDFKWVRISLKGNNMTATPADNDSTNSNQVCWDGQNQIVLPTGYGPTCTRYGSVIQIAVNDPGTGYTSAPTVTIDPPTLGGVQAEAVANLIPETSDSVASVTIINPGTTYTLPPTVSFIGDGTGATAVAHISPTGSPVASVALTSAGAQCYAVPPSVIFTGDGAGATAVAALSTTADCVAGLTIIGNCPARKSPPGDATVSEFGLTGGGGTGLSFTLRFGSGSGPASVYSIEDGGSGYSSVPTTPVTIASGANCLGLTATPILGRRIQSVTLISGGSGYTTPPAVSFTAGTGTTSAIATATATLGPATTGGEVTSVEITNGGSGYTAPPLVTFTPDLGDLTGVNAAGVAVIGVSNFKVGSISITNEGSGYTTDPAVSISGGGGSGALATATLGRGANWGRVYLLTGLAETRTGARSMVQMEVVTPVTGFSVSAALLLDGPNPILGDIPSSTVYWVDGSDDNSCGQIQEADHPAVGTYDDPNADPPTTSTQDVIDALPRPDHYIGEGTEPSVKNVFGGLGETMGTPEGLKALIDAIAAVKTNVGNTVNRGSLLNPQINYIDGDLSLTGTGPGYGILVVTGTLTMGGDFSWFGPVLVVGDGIFQGSGGGNGLITGTLIIAKIWDNHIDKNLLAENGSPTYDWDGGGSNGIQYDHCWATNQMSRVPFNAPPSTRPLKILSTRTLPY